VKAHVGQLKRDYQLESGSYPEISEKGKAPPTLIEI
jgi:hypothetical protein